MPEITKRRLWRSRSQHHGELIRHYFLFSLGMICAGLILSGALEVYFSRQENFDHFAVVQKEIAVATAFKIEQFLQEHERVLKAATRSRELVSHGFGGDYRWELRRLLVNAPAVTAAVAYDLRGVRRVAATRLRPVTTNKEAAPLDKGLLKNAVDGKVTYGPVYFADGTGPFMSIIVPIERVAGEVIGALKAEVDLKYIGQVMVGVHFGKAGYAYLVSNSGELIAHPDLSLVLQKRNLRTTEQLKVALETDVQDDSPRAFASHNLLGRKVFTSFANVAGVGWLVFVEQPIQEIYEPIFASLFRTSGAFLVALIIALLAILSIRHRVVRPLETLRRGVERIRGGDLTAQIAIRSGDEFEELANEFNSMATNLRNAYGELERKVNQRTQELTFANEKLAEASEQKSRFLANANHELRTPLSSIIGYARILRRDAHGVMTPLQLENLDDLMRNAERLLTLIDELLDIARIEAGKVDLQVQPVDVQEVLHSVILTVQPMINGQAVRLVQDLTPNLPKLMTDGEKLRQILLNLAGNAVKFTEQGEIRLVAGQKGDDLELVVADTGIGIKPEELEKIFEEFHRGQTLNNGNHRGTGLGLAIVKKLVELLGGNISVTSEPGKGSSFTVTLPFQHMLRYPD